MELCFGYLALTNLFGHFFDHFLTTEFLKKILCIYLYLERREGRERGRETLMCERYINWLPLTRSHLGTWPATQTLL